MVCARSDLGLSQFLQLNDPQINFHALLAKKFGGQSFSGALTVEIHAHRHYYQHERDRAWARDRVDVVASLG